MSSDWILPIQVLILLGTEVVFVLSSVRALEARRAMAGLIYRSRALWTAVFALLFIPFEPVGVYAIYGSPQPLVASLALVFVIVFNLAAFFFLNSTILVARELDFLHRNTMYWGKTRWVVFGLIVLGMIGTLFSQQLRTDYRLFNIIWTTSIGYVAIVVVAASLRVKDSIMRGYTKWLGIFVAAGAIPFFYQGPSPFPFLIGFGVASLFYYLAANSLLRTSHVRIETAQ